MDEIGMASAFVEEKLKRNLTCIQVSRECRERLKKYKIAKRESYEEILTRIMDKLDKEQV